MITEIPKKPRVTTLMDTQHVKGSERWLKSARQHFCHIFSSFSKEISSKKFVLVVFGILTHFNYTLTPNNKYSLSVKAGV